MINKHTIILCPHTVTAYVKDTVIFYYDIICMHAKYASFVSLLLGLNQWIYLLMSSYICKDLEQKFTLMDLLTHDKHTQTLSVSQRTQKIVSIQIVYNDFFTVTVSSNIILELKLTNILNTVTNNTKSWSENE